MLYYLFHFLGQSQPVIVQTAFTKAIDLTLLYNKTALKASLENSDILALLHRQPVFIHLAVLIKRDFQQFRRYLLACYSHNIVFYIIF